MGPNFAELFTAWSKRSWSNTRALNFATFSRSPLLALRMRYLCPYFQADDDDGDDDDD
eukprot:CAMPEP_0170197348 /NCGR_PEP_ID=MMETSP0040_2-20121228/66181_1 /TAXON_ID=641309 /ORGANISM="Lotharella oceanica, Strain CCMP622" /LENGTH=57 /DNA_ID=CAMNT_0010446991 /DNA_START=560 /DNA_END=730 /DNA_ORIENTATION=-